MNPHCLELVRESLCAVALERQAGAGRRTRHASARTVKLALRDVAEVVALLGLHRPVHHELVGPVLDAIEQVAGCPKSLRRRRPLRRFVGKAVQP